MERNLAIFQSSQRGQEASDGNNTVSVPLHLEHLCKTKKHFLINANVTYVIPNKKFEIIHK